MQVSRTFHHLTDSSSIKSICKVAVPALHNANIDQLRVKQLTGGTTNVLFKVRLDHAGDEHDPSVLVRINGVGTEQLIDRTRELKMMQSIARQKEGPRVHCVLPNGIIYDFIPGETINDPAALSDYYHQQGIAKKLSRWHKIVIMNGTSGGSKLRMWDQKPALSAADKVQQHSPPTQTLHVLGAADDDYFVDEEEQSVDYLFAEYSPAPSPSNPSYLSSLYPQSHGGHHHNHVLPHPHNLTPLLLQQQQQESQEGEAEQATEEASSTTVSNVVSTKRINQCHPAMITPDNPMLFRTIYKWLNIAKEDLAFAFRIGVDLYQIEQEVRALEELLKDSPITFCHNDLNPKNIIYNDRTFEYAFIDNEYCDYNYRGFDIGNHFCEHADTLNQDKPYDLLEMIAAYPSKETQIPFLTAYLESFYDVEPSEEDVNQLYQEVSKFSLLSHLLWGIWGINKARSIAVATATTGTTYSSTTSTSNRSNADIDDALVNDIDNEQDIESKVEPEAESESTNNFDYVAYAKLRIMWYFADKEARLAAE